MTDERMALIELIEKQADSDFVRDMLAFAADRIMEMEVGARMGAVKGARSLLREVERNGYRGRAAARRMSNATHQRCRIHWMRNALAHAPTKQRMGWGRC